ncbi:hypothetical protein [uncultured Alistipes sp.]|uniref:hypothetical protein n=1 Tax=uncultured Alistipes sp. TaxID=538949 RepID=UPI0026244E39|nr:hypothetical protein [uncultured Alistipes sp.]
MKLMNIPKKTAVQAVVAFVVIGALLGRECPLAGRIVSMCAVGGYLLLVGRRALGYLLRFGSVTAERRALALTALGMAGVFVHAAVAGTVSYFSLVLLLAVDYFVYDRHGKAVRK